MTGKKGLHAVNFGPDEARGDRHLAEYFVRTPVYEKVARGDAFLVIGRKGTGKTALLQMVAAEADVEAQKFTVFLSLRNAPTKQLFDSGQGGYKPPNQYQPIWKFMLALETAKLAMKDESVPLIVRDALQKFIERNFGNVAVGMVDAVGALHSSRFRLGFSLPEILSGAGAHVELGSDAGTGQGVHFEKAAEAIFQKLSEIETESEYWLLLDELDEDYRVEAKYFHLIISLLKAVASVAKLETRGLKIRPVVVLRDDIFPGLDDADLNKLRDYTAELRWNAEEDEIGPLSLRTLVEKRIVASLGAEAGDEPWFAIADEANWTSDAKTIWSFVIARTMDRPRDVLRFLKCAQERTPESMLGVRAVDDTLDGYAEWLYREIGDEIYRELPEWRDVLRVFTRLGRAQFNRAEWIAAYLDSMPNGVTESDAVDNLKLLFRFGVIGQFRGQHWELAYKTPHLAFDPAATLFLHRGLRKHLLPWKADVYVPKKK